MTWKNIAAAGALAAAALGFAAGAAHADPPGSPDRRGFPMAPG